MGSQSSTKVPVINFCANDMTPDSTSWCTLRTEVHRALEVYGCFEAVFGDNLIHSSMVQAVSQLFDLPLETRQKYPSNDRTSGRPTPEVPLWSKMGINDVQDPGKLDNFTRLMWPQGNSNFCESVDSYIRQTAKLEQMVKRMVFESYGLQGPHHDSIADATSYWLRLNKYRAREAHETNLGLGLHTDSGVISILTQNDVSGLEIQTRDGEWISVTPSPANYVVLVGDSFMAWSNGRLHAPPHRVMMNSDRERYSILLFSLVRGITVETPAELVDEEHPLLFKPLDHYDYRAFISTEKGMKADSPIRTYCGVGV